MRPDEEIIEKEREWLLYSEIPLVVSLLKQNIVNSLCCLGTNQASAFATKVIGPEPTPEQQKYMSSSRIVSSFESPHGQLKGFVTAEGWTVREAEFVIRNQQAKQPNIKVAITPQRPLVITQIQSAHNYLDVALVQTLDLETYLEEIKRDDTHESSSSSSTSPSKAERINEAIKSILHRIEKISLHLVKAQQQLQTNVDYAGLTLQSVVVPNTLFSPGLPVGLLIRVSIEKGELAMSLYYLNKLKKSPATIIEPGHMAQTQTQSPIANTAGSYIGYTL
eukprot:TRINITY_DN2747_c0_g1_i3.p1 TRINITY_DN2747_c0_g1~~TRINITY_DN2747_c0_g1_i3.p1  ORF type:complete len:278 (-),score=55.28 TRINITY_DN2747_c0_g1_i3:296-1129(-)